MIAGYVEAYTTENRWVLDRRGREWLGLSATPAPSRLPAIFVHRQLVVRLWVLLVRACHAAPTAELGRFRFEWELTGRELPTAYRVLVPKGSIYVCAAAGPTVTDVLVALRAAGFVVKNIVTWHKSNGAPNPFGRLYTRASELIVFAVKASGWTFHAKALRDLNPERQQDGSPKMMRDVWTIPATSGHERPRGPGGRAIHPTQKPEAVIRRLIVGSSNPGDRVLDPFLGSGTTAVVAESLGRRWIGIEQSRSYVAAARARLQPARRQRGPVRAHRTSAKNRSDRSPHTS